MVKKHDFILSSFYQTLVSFIDYITDHPIQNISKVYSTFRFNERALEQLFKLVKKEDNFVFFKETWSFELVSKNQILLVGALENIAEYSFSAVKTSPLFRYLTAGMPPLIEAGEIQENNPEQIQEVNPEAEKIREGILCLALCFGHLEMINPFFEVFSYLRKNTIDSALIQDIIVEETDLDTYNLSIRHLNYVKDINNILNRALDLIDESGDIEEFTKNITALRIEEFKGKLDLFDKPTIDNVISLLNQRSDSNRATKKTLDIVFTCCRYEFLQDTDGYSFTIIQESESGTNELTQELLKEQIGNLRVAKSLIKGNSEENDYPRKIDCLIKIYDQVRLLISKVNNILNQGFITSLKQAYEKCGQNDANSYSEFYDDFNFCIELEQTSFNPDCIKIFQHEDLSFAKIEEEVSRRSREILNDSAKYYLNFMSGLQYKVLLDFLYKKDTSLENSNKAISLLNYAFDSEFVRGFEKKILKQEGELDSSLSYLTLEMIDCHPRLKKAISRYEQRVPKPLESEKKIANPRYILYEKNSQKYYYYLKFGSKNPEFENHHRYIFLCTMYTTKT